MQQTWTCIKVLDVCLCPPSDQGDWNGNQRAAPGKAPPPSRGAKTSYREHPYQQYWSGRAALKGVPPPSSSCLPWQLALSSPTKVIVRFVFGYVFSTPDFLWERIGNWKSDPFSFCGLTTNLPPPPPTSPLALPLWTGHQSSQAKWL